MGSADLAHQPRARHSQTVKEVEGQFEIAGGVAVDLLAGWK